MADDLTGGQHLPLRGEGWDRVITLSHAFTPPTLPHFDKLRTGLQGMRVFARAAVFCFLSAVLGPLTAEELPDPTRPPESLAGPGAASGQWAAAKRPSGLQSTLISKSRRAAIIDGKTVELGGKHGDARLTEVSEGRVVLQGAHTRRVLTLFPDVKITQSEINSKTQPPGSGLRPNIFSTKPVVRDETLLSMQPKEKK